MLTNDLTADFGGVETANDLSSGQTPATYGVVVSTLSIADGGYVSTPAASSGSAYGLTVGDGTTFGAIVGKGSLEFRDYSPDSQYDVAGVIKIAKTIADQSVIVRVLPSSHVSAIDIMGRGTVVFGAQAKDVVTMNTAVPVTVEAGANATLYFLSACAQFGGMGSSVSTSCLQPQSTTHNYSGNLTLNAQTTVGIDPSATVNMTGTVTGKDKITKTSGSGVLNIGGSQLTIPQKTTNYIDTKDTEAVTVVENETAIMAQGAVRSSVMVQTGGVLKGLGSFKYSIWIQDGGTVEPGMSPGCLSSDMLQLYGTYQFELGGSDPCTGYDQLKVMNTTQTSSTVILGSNSVLATSRYNGYTPEQGQAFTIIEVAGSQAVDGTFKDLPEGATFEQNGVVFKITYKGGDGNDVVLTVQNQPTAPDTGFALVSANPLLTLGATAGAALLLLGIARKTRPAHARAHTTRRRK